MADWKPIPGETQIDPSGLRVRGVENRRDLAILEARNIRQAVVKYLAARPSRRSAPFDVPWLLELHARFAERERPGDDPVTPRR